MIGRLVAEISTARTVEKALYARRLLFTGRQVPEVYATEVARQHADTAIAELDKEIESLLFETRVRREVVPTPPPCCCSAPPRVAKLRSMCRKPSPSIHGRSIMAACRSGSRLRRRWFFTLSLLAALAMVGVGMLLWQMVQVHSLTAVSTR